MAITRSYFQCEDIEIRAVKDDEKRKTLTGYAAKWEKMSQKIYNFREKIRSGAFAKSILSGNVRALWNHNTDLVLGSQRNGTLRLKEDEKGLRFELDLPDTQAGRDAEVIVSRGDVDGMSFAFDVIRQEWDKTDPDNVVRSLIDVTLHEISPTAFPAYPDTKVKARSVKDDYEEYEATEAVQTQKQKNEIELKKLIINLHDKEL